MEMWSHQFSLHSKDGSLNGQKNFFNSHVYIHTYLKLSRGAVSRQTELSFFSVIAFAFKCQSSEYHLKQSLASGLPDAF
jgi:hypothetical protein